MNLPTQVERDLFNYLSLEGKVKVEEHFAALEADNDEEEPERDFVMERAKLEADREDAGEHQAELAHEDADRLRDEAIELMVREEPELDEDRLRDEENERRML